MARHKTVPQVPRAAGKRLLWELGKDVLILLLTCSALFLLFQTPMVTQLRDLAIEPAPTHQANLRPSTEAVTPYALAVRTDLGLYGVSYDRALVERAFSTLSPLLGEALAEAGSPQAIDARQWLSLLDCPGFFCAFQGAPPLSVLASWLGSGGGPQGEAENLLLAWDGQQTWLAWREGKRCLRAAVSLSYDERVAPLLSGFNPNGASYAYSLAQSDPAYATLDPDVLVGITAPQAVVYTAAVPDLVGDSSALEQLLSSLGFQSGVNSAYGTAEGVAINENGDRLRLTSSGQVAFYAGEEVRYPPALGGSSLTAQEAALTAWDLLNRAVQHWQGASYVLTSVREEDEGWTVTFHARLDGIPVLTGDDGWAARFTVTSQGVRSFSLTLRSYTAGETASVLTGERLAAAALQSLPGAGGRLRLCYTDLGAGTLSAGWIAESPVE